MFMFFAFLIFSGAMGAAAYYVWSVPRQQERAKLAGRLRELRLSGGARARMAEGPGPARAARAARSLGDFVAWIGVLRRLQESIDQANLKYRAADVFALCVDHRGAWSTFCWAYWA